MKKKESLFYLTNATCLEFRLLLVLSTVVGHKIGTIFAVCKISVKKKREYKKREEKTRWIIKKCLNNNVKKLVIEALLKPELPKQPIHIFDVDLLAQKLFSNTDFHELLILLSSQSLSISFLEILYCFVEYCTHSYLYTVII